MELSDTISTTCKQPSDLCYGRNILASASFFTTAEKKVIIGWGRRLWMSQPGDLAIPYFYFPYFFCQESRPWCCHTSNVEMSIDQFLETMEDIKSEVPSPLNWQSPAKTSYKKTFDELQRAFAAKSLFKAVPYLFETADGELTPRRLQNSLVSLLKYTLKHPIYAYGFWEDGSGMLGGTPELLFQANGKGNRRLETAACAGTRAAGCDELQFLNDPKESYEHNIVIKGIAESLTALGGSFKVEKTKVLHLSRFSHLLTPIHASFNQNVSFDSIVKELHPTPALGAWPLHPNGLAWLKDYERQVPRRRFGAPVGYYNPQNHHSVCMVAIRNVQWQDQQLAIGAGGGIVPDSQFEEEWKEQQMKITATKEMLAL